MRYIFYFWFLPMGFFWGWFGLSYYDLNMGTLFFSRDMHDLVFDIYSSTLNLQTETVVWLLVRACIIDTFLIFGILAFRRRKAIKAWYNRNWGKEAASAPAYGPASSIE